MNNNTLDNRNKKIINFFKNPKVIFPIILILLVVLGMYIRVLPMTAHGVNPGLWDVTTNDWTLGPDLDPWSFVRQAKNIAYNGSIPQIDTMRNVPLGIDTSRETLLLPYMIYGVYQVSNMFNDFNMEFAGALRPVLMFGLTIIFFFLFVKETCPSSKNYCWHPRKRISWISIYVFIFLFILKSNQIKRNK